MGYPLHHCSYGGVNGSRADRPSSASVREGLHRGPPPHSRGSDPDVRRPAPKPNGLTVIVRSMPCLLAIDAGTSGVRTLAFDETGQVLEVSYRELSQFYPHPSWVEHDATEIRDAVCSTLNEVGSRLVARGVSVDAVGITNQRETVVSWDRGSGNPLARAVVWQDRRTSDRCRQLEDEGLSDMVRARTGLVLDPYFSATKIEWLLKDGGIELTPATVFATVDAWLIWNLTGGPDGGVLATEASNASRTMLMDIAKLRWSEELCELFGVPVSTLPEIKPSCGRFGELAGDLVSDELRGVPVSAVAGDQQAALFGQACFDKGMAKATYGTGTFVLLNVGAAVPAPVEGLLTSVAWDLDGRNQQAPISYVLEGAVFSTGSAIQWLRDGLGLIAEAAEIGPLAEQVPGTDGVYVVPAFTGLGSPWWDPYARGVVTGLTRGAGRAHVARAVVEAMAYQVRDVVDAMRDAGAPLAQLRVDGGASVMDLLLQLQADQIRSPVIRAACAESTGLGAATMAGLAEGTWGSLAELSKSWASNMEFEPSASKVWADSLHSGWRRAVDRSREWARADT